MVAAHLDAVSAVRLRSEAPFVVVVIAAAAVDC